MPEITSLTIITGPNKLNYVAGDRFERYGMSVRADYSDGTSAEIPFFECLPSRPLVSSDAFITVSFMGKSARQGIFVSPVCDEGYFQNVCLRGAELGGNPCINAGDLSVRYRCRPMSVGMGPYETSLRLVYSSRMTDGESDLIQGLPKGWRTDFHRFLVQDGQDESDNPIYKYIDGDGYFHSFRYDGTLDGYMDDGGCGLFLDPQTREISDMSGNSMSFDTYGRIVSVSEVNGKTTAIEYNNNGLRKVYDSRKTNDYIKLSYDATGSLRWIRVCKNNIEKKIYDIIGMLGQITSIRESANGSSRELHMFSVNDRDRVNRMVDRLTGEAYRVTYEFDPFSFNDYIIESVRSGHMDGGSFAESSAVIRGAFQLRGGYPDGLSKDVCITPPGGKSVIHSLDSKGRLVSCMEYANYGRDLYSMDQVEGVFVPYGGQSLQRVNGRPAVSFSNSVTVPFGLSETDLRGSPNAKISGYISLGSESLRARLVFMCLGEDSEPVDINPCAYGVWQYFEIPFTRERDGHNVSFSSFSLRVFDQDGSPMSAMVSDMRFKESEGISKVIFDNYGSSVDLSELVAIKITNYAREMETIPLGQSGFRFTAGDLISTLRRRSARERLICLVSLNAGEKATKTYGCLRLVFAGGEEVDAFELDNAAIIQGGENWHIDGPVLKSKTYFDFRAGSWSVTSMITMPGETECVSSKVEYDYVGRVLSEMNIDGGGFRYEYFPDGDIMRRKAFSSDGEEITVFEESRDGDVRDVTEDGITTSYSYSGDLLTGIVLPGMAGSGMLSIGYDAFMDDLASVAFRQGGAILSRNELIEESSPISVTFSDGFSSYRVESYEGGRRIKEYSLGPGGDSLTKEVRESIFSSSEIIYGSPSLGQVTNITRDSYGKMSSISNVNRAAQFSYRVSPSSSFTYQTAEIDDGFSDLITNIWHDGYGRVDQVETGRLCVIYANNPGIDERTMIFDGDGERYESRGSGDHFEFRDAAGIVFSTVVSKDGFGRVSGKEVSCGGATIEENHFFEAGSFSRPSAFEFGNVEEFYSHYAETGKLSTRSSHFPMFTVSRSYYYDSFGRLTREVNSRSCLDRSYTYSGSRMSCFGSNMISYDDRGRMSQFGGMYFEYDNHGNMISKSCDGTDTVYTYDRGRLLSSVSGKASFTYDYKGRRTRKALPNGSYHEYHYDGDRLIAEDIRHPNYRSFSRIVYVYDGQGLIGFSASGFGFGARRDFLYVRNQMGDVIGIMEGDELVAAYDCDAWGNVKTLNPDGSENASSSFIGNINPIRYKGYYYDVETGLYWLSSRYYDPEIGRFISPDSVDYLDPTSINGLNLYAYCNNDPVNYCDPSGHFPQWAKWAIGIGVIGILAIATVATAGIAGVGVGAAFAAGFSGAAIGVGASGLAVTIAGSAFAGAVIGAGIGLVGGGIAGAIGTGTWNGALEGAANGFMMGSITGAISGGIRGGINYARTTPLLRSVSPQELNSIRNSGQFSSSGSMESKWFATTKGNAAQWGNAFGQNDFVGIRVLKSALKNNSVYYLSMLDDIGAAYCIDNAYLNAIIHSMWFF